MDAPLHGRVALVTGVSRRAGVAKLVALLVAFLVSDDGGWTTAQVIDSEGGFRRGAW